MDFYQGISNDQMTGGGKQIDKHGWGAEMFNFKPSNGRHYGYVRVSKDRQINIDRLGAKSTDDKLDKVTIVWTAKHPDTGGTHIIGWYKNATLFRYYQEPAKSLNRKWKQHILGYCMTAKTSDSKLLSKDERLIKVPRGSNGMGQTNIWYGNNNPDFVKTVEQYIQNGKIPSIKKTKTRKGSPRQIDPLKRIEVETKAVKFVIKYYKKLGYELTSVEKDNVGWDLTAINDKITLKLEVKGLSGKDIAAELTPNEFSNLQSDTRKYRLCIVTETLTAPKLKIFSHSTDNCKWTSEDGTTLRFEKIISARIYKE